MSVVSVSGTDVSDTVGVTQCLGVVLGWDWGLSLSRSHLAVSGTGSSLTLWGVGWGRGYRSCLRVLDRLLAKFNFVMCRMCLLWFLLSLVICRLENTKVRSWSSNTRNDLSLLENEEVFAIVDEESGIESGSVCITVKLYQCVGGV